MHFFSADGQIVMTINDGKIVGINESVDINEETNKENVNISNINENNDTMIIASMEEILISTVQDRPPLWNFKDTLPSQWTKAARDKLWEEIEDLLNTNKEKSV